MRVKFYKIMGVEAFAVIFIVFPGLIAYSFAMDSQADVQMMVNLENSAMAAQRSLTSLIIPKEELVILEEIPLRTLWLAMRMIDFANHNRINTDGIKVGGHQASSASMISILTSLYMYHLV